MSGRRSLANQGSDATRLRLRALTALPFVLFGKEAHSSVTFAPWTNFTDEELLSFADQNGRTSLVNLMPVLRSDEWLRRLIDNTEQYTSDGTPSLPKSFATSWSRYRSEFGEEVHLTMSVPPKITKDPRFVAVPVGAAEARLLLDLRCRARLMQALSVKKAKAEKATPEDLEKILSSLRGWRSGFKSDSKSAPEIPAEPLYKLVQDVLRDGKAPSDDMVEKIAGYEIKSITPIECWVKVLKDKQAMKSLWRSWSYDWSRYMGDPRAYLRTGNGHRLSPKAPRRETALPPQPPAPALPMPPIRCRRLSLTSNLVTDECQTATSD